MAYLDGELPPSEVESFERLLAEHPEWRAEVEEMAALVSETDKLKVRIDPAIWDNYWEEIDSRLHRRVGWGLLLVGAVLLIVLGTIKVYTLANDNWVRGGISLVLLGLVILFVAVLRGRFLEIPRDRYGRIKR